MNVNRLKGSAPESLNLLLGLVCIVLVFLVPFAGTPLLACCVVKALSWVVALFSGAVISADIMIGWYAFACVVGAIAGAILGGVLVSSVLD